MLWMCKVSVSFCVKTVTFEQLKIRYLTLNHVFLSGMLHPKTGIWSLLSMISLTAAIPMSVSKIKPNRPLPLLLNHVLTMKTSPMNCYMVLECFMNTIVRTGMNSLTFMRIASYKKSYLNSKRHHKLPLMDFMILLLSCTIVVQTNREMDVHLSPVRYVILCKAM